MTGVQTCALPIFNEKGIAVNDIVLIRKAGEIIPEVVSVVHHFGNPVFKLPKNCPSCNQPVVRLPDDSAVRCINIDCPAQLLRHIVHFASRDAMNIDGLGEAVALQLLEQRLVVTPLDLFKLKMEDVSKLSRMGKKSAKNLLEAINSSKDRDLSRLIFALGIRNVGLKAAQLLAERFGSIDLIMAASGEELSKIDGVGEVIASNIVNFFSQEHNRLLIKCLKELGINTDRIKEQRKDGVLSGKTFVLTGTLPSMTRSKAAELIEKAGGIVSDNVSKNTSYIVAGENPGSKLAKGID